MARLLTAIVEARIHPSKKNPKEAETADVTCKRTIKAILTIIGKALNGYVIGGLCCSSIYGELNDYYRHLQDERIDGFCIVPDFGHSIRCKCIHADETPFGVLRLFGLDSIAIEGYPETEEIFGTYEIDKDTRIEICSQSCLVMPENPVSLTKLSGLYDE